MLRCCMSAATTSCPSEGSPACTEKLVGTRWGWRNEWLHKQAKKESSARGRIVAVIDIESLLVARHDAHPATADASDAVVACAARWCESFDVFEPALRRVKHDAIRKVLDPSLV